jgi:hypothetical protein
MMLLIETCQRIKMDVSQVFLIGLIWNGSRYKIQNRCLLIILTMTNALQGGGIKKSPN